MYSAQGRSTMRYGFFYGIRGDLAALREVFEVLGDCDRVVSLGDLVARPSPGDAGCLSRVLGAEGGAAKVLLLAGRGERERAHDLTMPTEVRVLLRGLLSGTAERGIAMLGAAGSDERPREEARVFGDRPRLVCPFTIAAGKNGTRVWRAAAGGIDMLGSLGGAVPLPRSSERLRVELGPAVDGGILRCAVVDLDARTLELRERLRLRHAAAPRERRRSAG